MGVFYRQREFVQSELNQKAKYEREVRVELRLQWTRGILEVCEDKAGKMQSRTEGRLKFHSKWEPGLGAYVQ